MLVFNLNLRGIKICFETGNSPRSQVSFINLFIIYKYDFSNILLNLVFDGKSYLKVPYFCFINHKFNTGWMV